MPAPSPHQSTGNHDHKQILEIDARLSQEKSATGFLTRIPTIEELIILQLEGGLYVSRRDNQIVGYLTTHHALSENPEMKATREKFGNIKWTSNLPPLDQLIYCDQMAIRPDVRKRGVASELLQSLFDAYPSSSFLAAIVEAPICNVASRELCLKHGFLKIGERTVPEYRGLQDFRSGWYVRNR